jgi:predicted aconitase with swiveling domain
MKLQGRPIYRGIVEGEALVTTMGISFFGGVNPETGIIVEKGHELEGQSINGKILVFPTGKGSTVGSYTLYQMKYNNKAPKAIINVISEIPCVDQIPIEQIKTGMKIRLDGEKGVVEG